MITNQIHLVLAPDVLRDKSREFMVFYSRKSKLSSPVRELYELDIRCPLLYKKHHNIRLQDVTDHVAASGLFMAKLLYMTNGLEYIIKTLVQKHGFPAKTFVSCTK